MLCSLVPSGSVLEGREVRLQEGLGRGWEGCRQEAPAPAQRPSPHLWDRDAPCVGARAFPVRRSGHGRAWQLRREASVATPASSARNLSV